MSHAPDIPRTLPRLQDILAALGGVAGGGSITNLDGLDLNNGQSLSWPGAAGGPSISADASGVLTIDGPVSLTLSSLGDIWINANSSDLILTAATITTSAEIRDAEVGNNTAIDVLNRKLHGLDGTAYINFGGAFDDEVIIEGGADLVVQEQIHVGDLLRLEGKTSDPASPADGAVWHRSDTNELRVRLDGATRVIDTSAPT